MNITNKRWMIGSLFFLLFIWILSQSLSHTNNSHHEVIFTDVGFDTAVTFHAQCSEKEFEQYSKIVETVFKENHKRFDNYHSYKGINNLYSLNHSSSLEMDATFMDCLQLAISINKENHNYDPSIGSILSLWHEARETNQLPSDASIQDAKNHIGLNHLQINDNTITTTDPQVQLDLGGIAKGYTTQRAKEALEKAGCKHGFINAGGNVILIGNKEDGSAWTIGIQNPDKAESLLSIRAKKDQTFVTSGDYQRYVEVDGQRYNHIIDPETGYPCQKMRSVTVITDKKSGWADGISTALFCMDYQEGIKWAMDHDIDCVWIFDQDQAPNENPTLIKNGYAIYTTKGIEIQ